MNSRIENLVNVAIGAAALAIAATAVHKDLDRSRAAPAKPSFVKEWQSLSADGVELGASAMTSVRIIEFADIECPYCAAWNTHVLAPIREQFGDSVGITIMHYPLRGHRFAVLGATAVECADVTHTGPALLRLLYDTQDSIGLKTWASYAMDAGVTDTAQFSGGSKQARRGARRSE
jgi:protein-disulfide isomerase